MGLKGNKKVTIKSNKISVLPSATDNNSNTNHTNNNYNNNSNSNNSIEFGLKEKELSDYDQIDAESRLPYRSIPTQINGMDHANSFNETNGIDLTTKNTNLKDNDSQIDGTHDTKLAQSCAIIIVHPIYRCISMVIVVIALFAYDTSRTLVKSDLDDVTEVFLMIVFILLLADLICQSIVHKSYPGSFFFWLDLLGTITLLADISLTYEMFGYTQADLTVARGGRAGRAARTAGSLRISRIIMWVRVTRLIRIARILRYFKNAANVVFKPRDSTVETSEIKQQKSALSSTDTVLKISEEEIPVSSGANNNEENDSGFHKTHSSRIGIRVADSITRNVVFGILLTVCLVPIFNYTQEESYNSIYFAMNLFDAEYTANGISASLNSTIDSFLSTNANSDIGKIIQLNVADTIYKYKSDSIFRDTELLFFSSEYSTINLDISETIQIEHGMNIGFTMLIVFLFASLAFLISSNITKLVVRPIERMTLIVQEFTKNVCLLGGDIDDQQKVVSELLETELIAAAIETLSNIFGTLANQRTNNNSENGMLKSLNSFTNIPEDELADCRDSDDDGDVLTELNTNTQKNRGKHKKPTMKKNSFISPLPTNTSTTLFSSRDAVLTVNVVEKLRVYIKDDEIYARIREIENSKDIDSFSSNRNVISEFSSLQAVMSHPIAQQYFRLFCVEHMLSESYHFIKAVSVYHDEVRLSFMKVYREFLSITACNKISILDKESAKIYDKYLINDFGVRAFDGIRREIIASLSADAFRNFKQSKYSMAYVKSRDQMKKRYSCLVKRSSVINMKR